MKKTFVSNLILLVGLNLLIKPFYVLGIELSIQNEVGASQYGSYFALINLSFIFNMILDMGITNWNTRKVAQKLEISQVIPAIIQIRLALALLYLIIVSVVGFVFNYSTHQILWLVALAFNQVLAMAVLFFRSNLSGLHLFSKDSIIGVLDRALLILGFGYLLWAPHDFGTFRIEWLIAGQTIAYFLTAMIAGFWVFKHSPKLHWKTPLSTKTTILRQSLPFAVFSILGMVIYRADSVILERMTTADQAGHYAQGFRFFEAYNMISYLFAGLLLPIFSRMVSEKKPINEILSISHRQLFVATWIFVLGAIVFAQNILPKFYTILTAESIESFQWLMIGCFAFSMQYIYGTLLTAAGKIRPLTYLMIAGLLINIAFNLLFIPSKGAVACGQANALTQMFILILQILWVRKDFHISLRTQLKETIRFSIPTLALSVLIYSQLQADAIIDLPWTLWALIFVSINLLMASLTKMLSIQNFLQVMKSKD
jgi:O-antigen/teichoic acid export membrane protein